MPGYVPTRFYAGGVSSVNGNTTLYTVPAGKTAIITDWWFTPGGTDKFYDNFIYLGPSTLSYNIAPGETIGQKFRTYRGYQYRGFYVVHAGEAIMHGSNTASGESYTNVNGLLGSGDLDGKTPTRLGRTVSVAGTAQSNIFVASGGGAILKTILVANRSTAGTRAAALRIGATPIQKWGGAWTFVQEEVKQMNGSWFIAAGTALVFNDWDAVGGFDATAYGWQL